MEKSSRTLTLLGSLVLALFSIMITPGYAAGESVETGGYEGCEALSEDGAMTPGILRASTVSNYDLDIDIMNQRADTRDVASTIQSPAAIRATDYYSLGCSSGAGYVWWYSGPGSSVVHWHMETNDGYEWVAEQEGYCPLASCAWYNEVAKSNNQIHGVAVWNENHAIIDYGGCLPG